MTEELGDFLARLRSNPAIRNYPEAATSQGIVLPILQKLGWATDDVDEVTPEYPVESWNVDYALRLGNSSKVFIEVKKGGEDLEKHEEQVLGYSFREGVELAILTNGATWLFYLPTEKVNWSARRFYAIDIAERDAREAASEFAKLLSKRQIQSGEAISYAQEKHRGRMKEREIEANLPKAWNAIITEPDSFLVDLLSEVTEKLCGFKPGDDKAKAFLASHRDKFVLEPSPVAPTPPGKPASRRTRRRGGGDKISEEELISDILNVLRRKGGRAQATDVQEAIFAVHRKLFEQPYYQEKDKTMLRWKHRIASAKEEAKKQRLVKRPEEAGGKGWWELTAKGSRKARSQSGAGQ